MGRGIFFGLIWGGLVSVLGLSVASVVGTVPERPAVPEAEAVTQPDAESPNSAATAEGDDPGAEPPADATADPTEPVTAPAAPAPLGIEQPEAPVADTSPAALPETGSAVPELDAPEVRDDVADVAEEEPVLPSPQSAEPQPSDTEVVPEVAEDVPAADPVATEDVAPEDPDDGTPQEDTATSQPPVEEAAPSVVSEAPAEPVAPEIDTDASGPAQQQVTDDITDDTTEGAADDTAPSQEPTQDDAPRLALQSEQGSTLGQPVGTLTDRADAVETNRLPTITDTPETETDAETEASEGQAADPDAPPLERFAAAWDNPEARPLMSILLIDDGTSPIGSEALRSFPYPITFAVSATAPNAAEMAATYRAEGFEVLALADLPDGAAPSDIEVGIEASLANVPEATGLLIAGDVPGGRQGTEQIIEKLGQSGHGLVTAVTGLNSTAQLAESTGFPAANVFDDLDGEDQSPTVIRRFLDNAAFRAAQGEEVIMLGRIRPDTISALLLWGLGDRAGRVALVPVSAILTSE